MNVKPFDAEKLIAPSGKTLLLSLTCVLTIGAIATEYTSLSLEQFSLLCPLLVCTVVSALLGIVIIPLLNRLKTGQIVQEDGPQAHLKKAGTPTMGGIFFVPVAVVVSLLWVNFSDDKSAQTVGITPELIAVCLVTLGYGLIGWIDDWQVLRRKSNQGISPRLKLTLQIVFGAFFSLWLFWYKSAAIATISLPGGLNLATGWLFLPLAVFVLAAESNATNLTDGVDGLAAGTGGIAFLGLGAVLGLDYPDLAIFCVCFSGSCLGFLVHNRNPARVFMGDTGSLALGGALAAVGLSSNNLWALFLISGLFFVESLSVIAQVAYFKATKGADGKGKRLFKMAPIHHHFELSGWNETQVVGVFYLVNVLLVAIAYLSNSSKL
ncbi:phospho-N-acetylmuramoyl-pentapeptide-transferase [Pleurocapsa sp. CCALA 161]|uniref:phospho-N-acetylmuramoyl-pentapeptide- transferase n=1 Tax=Pleurocapsa sp. CCALA 161 TaxID=2107688 RepID=UPI0018EC9FCE|nr:phospho-N-acetylmuramoyl-pentapeptide-transferase [Pleurocapsa sp. CCALA 161]